MSHVFTDRSDAGRQLAAALPPVDPASVVVIALPRGGVPVAEEICKTLGAPMDLVFVRKIGAPNNPEVALGAVVDGAAPQVSVNPRVAGACGLSAPEVERMGRELLPEIERRRELYLHGLTRPTLEGKTLIVVDDGVATGATLRASLLALGKVGAARIILALPTAPPDVLPGLAALADDTICLQQPRPFYAVGAAYRHFAQTNDKDVVATLRRCALGKEE